MRITLFILAAALSIPLLASAKPYSTTSEFRDDKIVKGYLNIKLGTYGKMFEEPKGTSCDWVFVDPSFKVEDIRKESVLLYPDSITRNGGWDDSYWTMFAGLYGNGLVSSFESGVRTRGVQLQHPKPQTAVAAAPAATEPPSPSAIEQKIPPVPTMLRQKCFTRLSYGGHGRNVNVEGREFRKRRGVIASAKAPVLQRRIQVEVPG